MTKEKTSTSVKSAEKSTKSEVDTLLAKTEVAPPEPEKKKKKKETRGRKKKRVRPTYTKTKYTSHPVAQVINEAICGIINKSALKESPDKLKKEEIELGEAIVFTLDYYSDMMLHPVMVVVSAGVGVGVVTYNKMQKIPRKTDETRRLEKEGKPI